jgi:hypothetical protein
MVSKVASYGLSCVDGECPGSVPHGHRVTSARLDQSFLPTMPIICFLEDTDILLPQQELNM